MKAGDKIKSGSSWAIIDEVPSQNPLVLFVVKEDGQKAYMGGNIKMYEEEITR